MVAVHGHAKHAFYAKAPELIGQKKHRYEHHRLPQNIPDYVYRPSQEQTMPPEPDLLHK